MNVHVTERTTCRVCNSDQLVKFFALPDTPLIDNLLREEELGTEFRWPLRIYYCRHCHLTQTLHDVDVGEYYGDYQYTTGFSPFTRRFMRRLAEEVWTTYHFKPGDSVAEVGSGDGEQLACFQTLGARVFGFEPSAPLAQAARGRGISVSQRLFGEQATQDIPADLLPLQVVLSTYTFDHLPDPLDFLETVRRVLDPVHGVLVIEVHDLEKIFERREFCLFAHEHPAYYSAATIQLVFRQAGFDLIDVNFIPDAERRGNSLLVAAALQGSTWALQSMPTIPLGKLQIADVYTQFGKAVQDSLLRLREWVQSRRQQGERLAGYGAAGRGVMTLAAVAKPGDLAYVCDKNLAFRGYYTPASHILVDIPDRLLSDPVDEVVVFSFGYFREIYDELLEFRKRGGKLISLLDLL